MIKTSYREIVSSGASEAGATAGKLVLKFDIDRIGKC